MLVQNPDEARYSGMPTSAIATGFVDFVESAQALPALILRHSKKELARLSFAPPKELDPVEANSEELKAILEILKDKTGHDFRTYKLSTLQRRLARRIDATKSASVKNYINLLKSKPTKRKHFSTNS